MVLVVLGLADLVHGDPGTGTPRADPDAIDLSAELASLQVATDDAGHYLVRRPRKASAEFFWGTPEALHKQGVTSSSRTSVSLWSPRVANRAEVIWRDDGVRLECEDRGSALRELAGEERDTLLTSARFRRERWRRAVDAVARDDHGTYYLVDRFQLAFGGLGHRVFIGKKGRLKPQRLVDASLDGDGELFVLRGGRLELDHANQTATFRVGKRRTPLRWVDAHRNLQMIYNELGPYNHEQVGTPCDDL